MIEEILQAGSVDNKEWAKQQTRRQRDSSFRLLYVIQRAIEDYEQCNTLYGYDVNERIRDDIRTVVMDWMIELQKRGSNE